MSTRAAHLTGFFVSPKSYKLQNTRRRLYFSEQTAVAGELGMGDLQFSIYVDAVGAEDVQG